MSDADKIIPSHPPAEPFDVPTFPDPPPAAPFDVPTFPDAPPADPFDVPTFPDGPPGKPFEVPTNPDHPPGAPFDVSVSPDSPPAPPFDVPISPSPPPAQPFDVPTSPDSPPSPPFDVPTFPDAPPLPTFDVPIFPSRSPNDVGGRGPDPTTVDSIIAAVRNFDGVLANFLDSLIDAPPSISGIGGSALDPSALGRSLQRYTQAVGGPGVAKFIAEQAVLYAMNPDVARVFDPSYFLKMLIPGSMGHAHTTLDTQLGNTMETIVRAKDSLLVNGGFGSQQLPLLRRPDVYSSENRFTDGQELSVDELVDAALEGGSPYLRVERSPGGGTVSRFNANHYFEDRRDTGAMLAHATTKADAASGRQNVTRSRLAGSAAIDGVIPARFPGEEEDGSVVSLTQDPSDGIFMGLGSVDDDDARVPLSFTDLRKDPVRNGYRSVYFRPLNLAFSNAISPEYNEATAFGRVDPIVGYQKTTRSFTVSFEVRAFSIEDLRVIYNKMTWLSSMCYPSYGTDGLLRSGPVCRMRIGDAVATEVGGIAGVIKSLNFDFTDVTWELKRGMKVPQSFGVSLDFLTLHDGPIGVLNGVFGAIQIPTGANLVPSDGPSTAGDQVGTLPGRFSRFGESRRG